MALSLRLCPAADGADVLAAVADRVDAGDDAGLAGARAPQWGGTSAAEHPRAGSSGLAYEWGARRAGRPAPGTAAAVRAGTAAGRAALDVDR